MKSSIIKKIFFGILILILLVSVACWGYFRYWLYKAEQGDAAAQYRIGYMYHEGIIVSKDDVEAAKWVQKSAEQGDWRAETAMGNMESVKQNYIESVKWYRKAADKGYALAQGALGFMYYSGKGVKRDYVAAAIWFREAAEKGDSYAQYYFGKMYQNGDGLTKDRIEAVKWYSKSADKGYAWSEYMLGFMYHEGIGVIKDDNKSLEWYKKSVKSFKKLAEKDNIQAQGNLAFMYHEGRGVNKDYVEAAKWYRKATEKKDPQAQYHLGLMYYYGEGVKKDTAEAKRLYQKAAEQGHLGAIFNLGIINAFDITNNTLTKSLPEALIGNWYGETSIGGIDRQRKWLTIRKNDGSFSIYMKKFINGELESEETKYGEWRVNNRVFAVKITKVKKQNKLSAPDPEDANYQDYEIMELTDSICANRSIRTGTQYTEKRVAADFKF